MIRSMAMKKSHRSEANWHGDVEFHGGEISQVLHEGMVLEALRRTHERPGRTVPADPIYGFAVGCVLSAALWLIILVALSVGF